MNGETKPARRSGRPSAAVALAEVRAVVEQQAELIAALTVAHRDQAERLRVVENSQAEVRQQLRQVQLQLQQLLQQQAQHAP